MSALDDLHTAQELLEAIRGDVTELVVDLDADEGKAVSILRNAVMAAKAVGSALRELQTPETPETAEAPEARQPGREPLIFRMGSGFIGDYGRGVAEGAEIGDVILHMFKANQDDETVETFSEAVMGSVIDDLAVLDLAHDSDSTARGETQRQADRLRWRLIAARWLDRKLADAQQDAAEPQGAGS
jgi:hypothetical protein